MGIQAVRANMSGRRPEIPSKRTVTMWRWYYAFNREIQNLDREDWFLVLCCVVVVGFFCMRGFGSRAGY